MDGISVEEILRMGSVIVRRGIGRGRRGRNADGGNSPRFARERRLRRQAVGGVDLLETETGMAAARRGGERRYSIRVRHGLALAESGGGPGRRRHIELR